MLTIKGTRSGIDYLTATMKPTEDGSNLFWAMAKAVRELPEYEICEDRPWRFYGYKGFVLTAGSTGHFAYGEHNHTGYIVQMSGEYALRYWHQFCGASDNVSRIDIMVDAELFEPDPDMAKTIYDYCLDQGIYERRKYTVIMGAKSGQTLYVGSRRSDTFGRLYDKSAEMGYPSSELGRVWRYEVEFKKHQAKEMAHSLLRIYAEKPISELYSAIAGEVYRWFDKREVTPVWDRQGQGVDKVKLEATTKIGKAVWLRTQVSPTVRRLIMTGRQDIVIEALGLEDFFDIKLKE